MRRLGSMLGAALAGLVVLGGHAEARPRRPPPCTEGRFVLARARSLGAVAAERVVLAEGTVRIDGVCPLVVADLAGSRRATRLRARWDECPAVGRRVRLEARIRAPGRDRLRGGLRAGRRSRRIRAAVEGHAYDVPLDPGAPGPSSVATASRTAAAPSGRSRRPGALELPDRPGDLQHAGRRRLAVP